MSGPGTKRAGRASCLRAVPTRSSQRPSGTTSSVMDKQMVCLAMLFAVMVQIGASSSVLLRTDSVETSRDDFPSTTEPAVTNVGAEYTTPTQEAVAPQDSLDAESEDFEDETYLIKFESAALDGPDAVPLPRWEAQRLHGEAPGRVRRDSIVVRPLEVTRSRGSLASRQRDAKKKRGREQRPGAAQ